MASPIPMRTVVYLLVVAACTVAACANSCVPDSLPAAANPTTCYIDSFNDGGVGTEIDPFKTFGDAISNDCTTIYVAPGTYSGDGNYGLTATSDVLQILGTGTSALHVVVDLETHDHFLDYEYTGTGVFLMRGITIQNGKLIGSSSNILKCAPTSGECYLQDVVIRDTASTSLSVNTVKLFAAKVGVCGSVFEQNYARSINVQTVANTDNNALVVSNNLFMGNQAVSGAGLYATFNSAGEASVTISNNTFCGNAATNGAAVYLAPRGDSSDLVTIEFIDNMYIDNEASDYGGAVRVDDGDPTYLFLSFDGEQYRGNMAVDGGAIYITADVSTNDFSVTNSVFCNNTASRNGHSIYFTTPDGIVIDDTSKFQCMKTDVCNVQFCTVVADDDTCSACNNHVEVCGDAAAPVPSAQTQHPTPSPSPSQPPSVPSPPPTPKPSAKPTAIPSTTPTKAPTPPPPPPAPVPMPEPEPPAPTATPVDCENPAKPTKMTAIYDSCKGLLISYTPAPTSECERIWAKEKGDNYWTKLADCHVYETGTPFKYSISQFKDAWLANEFGSYDIQVKIKSAIKSKKEQCGGSLFSDSKKQTAENDMTCVCPRSAHSASAVHNGDGLHVSYTSVSEATCEEIQVREEGTKEWTKLKGCYKGDSPYTMSKIKLKRNFGGEWPTGDYATMSIEIRIISKDKTDKDNCGTTKSNGVKVISVKE